MLFVSPEDILAQIKTLPASPQMLPRLLAMLDQANSGLGELAALIRLERSLSARMVSIANSSIYAGATPCESVEEALHRIGLVTAYRLTSSLLGLELMAKPLRAYQCSASELSRQAMAGACAARAVAGLINEDSNRAYLLGLLHNVGMVMLDRLIQDKEPATLLVRGTDFKEWRESEMKVFGFDQADVGADMLQAWHFPVNLVKAVRYQYRANAAGRERPLAAIVQAARWLAVQINRPRANVEPLPEGLALALGCQPDDLAALPDKIQQEVTQLWADLGIGDVAVRVA